VVYATFNLTIILTFNAFHSLMFYYIITAMMAYLFVKQANELINQQNQRKDEQEQRIKLQLKLDQNQQQQQPSKLKLTGAGKTELLATDTISYCKAAGDYVEIHLNDQRQTLYSGSLKSLEEQLPSTFLKVHRSYLVNLDEVSSITSNAGNGFLQLANEQQVPVSRRVLPKVRGVLNSKE
jgi:DNA-binding LytR/AlgR family response regulator